MEWLVTVVWCFQLNHCCIHFYFVIAWWKTFLWKSEIPQTHLLMSFDSIRILASYLLRSPKINLWSGWRWLLGVSSQTIVIFTFNMILVNGKLFFRSQKDLKFIFLWDGWLCIKSLKINVWSDWWWLFGVSKPLSFTFNMLLLNGKLFFRSQKDLKFIYLWASIALELWLVIY